VSDGPVRLVDVTEMDTSWAWAAGAMVSTTADLARFYQALLGGQLLTPELLKEMRTTVDASQVGHGTRYGLGLEVLRPGCGVELWGHGGSLEGYGTTAFSTRDADRQLIMVTNLQPEPEPGAAAAAVENILRREVSC
jgi:D-alanyl-D-alanine carboxypeptidase